jgi:hypothetical protein
MSAVSAGSSNCRFTWSMTDDANNNGGGGEDDDEVVHVVGGGERW